MAYVNRRQQLMKQRRESTQKAIEKRKKENKERRDKIGGSARAYYKNNPGANTGNKTNNKKSIKKVDKPKVMQTRIKVGKRLIKKDSVEGRKILKSLKIRKKAAK